MFFKYLDSTQTYNNSCEECQQIVAKETIYCGPKCKRNTQTYFSSCQFFQQIFLTILIFYLNKKSFSIIFTSHSLNQLGYCFACAWMDPFSFKTSFLHLRSSSYQCWSLSWIPCARIIRRIYSQIINIKNGSSLNMFSGTDFCRYSVC